MTNMQIIEAAEQCRNEHRQWIQTIGTKPSKEEVDANLAGYAAGWRAAIAYLKIHGALKVQG